MAAVAEVIKVPHDDRSSHASGSVRSYVTSVKPGMASRRPYLDPERITARLERFGCDGSENLLLAIALLTTTGSPLTDADVDWIASTAGRISDPDLLLEAAGVVFAFNTINRIADARRVRLEFRFIRELKPIRGWVERRLASLTGLAYDLSFKHQPRHSPEALQDRLHLLLERLAIPTTPQIFNWLSRSPVVLEGVLEMIESNVVHANVRLDLLKEAIAIGVASRAKPGSELSKAIDSWLPRESPGDSTHVQGSSTATDVTGETRLVSACRRYAWQVANAAYTITDDQIRELSALGLSDAELLDLTLGTAVFSALAIIEPISTAVGPTSFAAAAPLPAIDNHPVQVQLI